MSEIKVATRYAKSLLDLAKEQNSLDTVNNDIVLLDKVIGENNELAILLKNPIVPLSKKQGVLNGIFQSKVSDLTLSFFKVVINKGRASLLYKIVTSFIEQYNSIKGIVHAEVVAASELNEQSKNEIISIVKNTFHAKEVIISSTVDTNLIGGFIIKVGDQQYDASISNKFVKLKKELGIIAH